MSRKMLLRAAFWGPCGLLTAWIATAVIASCGHGYVRADASGPCRDGTIVLPDCDGIVDSGVVMPGVSDELCESVLGLMQTARVDAVRAPQVQAPANNSQVIGNVAVVFQWSAARFAMRSRELETPDISEWILPRAEADCMAYSGAAYVLTVTDANNTLLLRVMTSSTSYRPDAYTWSRMRASVMPLRVRVEATQVAENVLRGVPVVSPNDVSFWVSP